MGTETNAGAYASRTFQVVKNSGIPGGTTSGRTGIQERTRAMKTLTGVIVIAVSCLGALVATSASGQTEGLLGEYYRTVNMSNLAFTRIDPQVFFDWETNAPDPRLGVDGFSVSWTGFVMPAEGGEYTFYVTSDDGVRLWLDDAMVVNQWQGQAPTEYSATATLIAGTPIPIQIDYYENSGGAVLKLEWEGPGITREAIPAANLLPGAEIGDRMRFWHQNPENGHYYKMIGPCTWAEGKAQAESMGGYLAVLDNEAESDWLVRMFRPVSDVGFIGANDIATEGVWVWDQTGQNFWNGAADGSPAGGLYADWNSGEPNNSGDDGEDVATVGLSSGGWNDLNVARERYCIVESDAGQINYDGPFPAEDKVELETSYRVFVTVRNPLGTVQYQWYKNKTLIPGATASSLLIPHATYDDAGLYTCLITGETLAPTTTTAAKLTVVEELPALTVPGLAALAALLSLAAALRGRKK